MTLILRIKGKINNPNAPKLIEYDPIESKNGSIFLWDAGRQRLSNIDNGAVVPNIFEDYAGALGKSFSIQKGVASENDSYARVELTGKGALHFMVSQNYPSAISGEAFWGVLANADLRQKLYSEISNNPDIYLSFWIRGTRKGQSRSGKFGPMLSYVRDNASNFATYMTSKNSKPEVAAGSTSISKLNIGATENAFLAPNYHQVNIKSFSYTGITEDSRLFLGSGLFGPWSSEIALNESPSFAVYRIYIEDLKLSGRTFEQVKAIDDAEFEKAFAIGGRFNGDTWSDPASILP